MRARESLGLLKETFQSWSDDNASTMAAALAYFAVFALAPLLIIVIEIGAAFLGGPGHNYAVKSEILRQLRPYIGTSGANAIGDLVDATFNQRQHQGAFAVTVGWVLFIVAATGFFAAVQNALDTVWHLQRKNAGVLATLLTRSKSLAIIAALSIVFMLSFVANAGLSAVSGLLAARIPGWHYLVIGCEAFIAFLLVSAAFAVLFKFLPQTLIAWRDVITGSAITAALFILGQYAIGMYLGRVSVGSTYGAAGSLVVLLVWLYYSGQIFLFGAEFTKVYATRYGSRSAERQSSATGTVEPTATRTASV